MIRKGFALGMVLVLFVAGCSSQDDKVAEKIVGKWTFKTPEDETRLFVLCHRTCHTSRCR